MKASPYRLRELPAHWWRIVSLSLTLIILSIVIGLLLSALVGLVAWVVLQLLGFGSTAIEWVSLVANTILLMGIVFLPLWVVIRFKFKFWGGRVVFVRDSLLDQGMARRSAGTEVK